MSDPQEAMDCQCVLISETDGFFDAGMLPQALKASQEDRERLSDKVLGVTRRAVGKKLRLGEY